VIENDEDVDDGFRGETANCGAADVMNCNNSLTKDRIQYRSFFLESGNPGWIIVDDFDFAGHWSG
jgi:hypothetical protein